MVKKQFGLRKAVPSDLPAIVLVFEQAIRKTCAKDYSQEQINAWAAGSKNASGWLQRIASQYFLVAMEGDVCAGFGSLDDTGYLDLLYVNPDYLGQGVARNLIHALIAYAHRHNMKTVTSDVSITARPAFAHLGFTVQHENHPVVNGVGLVNYRMVLEM